MLEIILSGVFLISVPVLLKYYKKNHRQNNPLIPAETSIDTSYNQILDMSFNEVDKIDVKDENIVSLYSEPNFLGSKKELSVGVYNRGDMDFVINSIKFITKKGHILFYKDDLRIRSYTSDISNTIEFIKSINGWTTLQVCKF
jgi:hypothetical protein